MGLPIPESEEALGQAVRQALIDEGHSNERFLAYIRSVAAAGAFGVASVAYVNPLSLETDRISVWFAIGALGVLTAAVAFLAAIERGWYTRSMRLVVPLMDGCCITAGGLALGQVLDSPPSTGFIAVVAATCAFLAFSGSLRLSQSSAAVSTGMALIAWFATGMVWGLRAFPLVLIGLTISITGVLSTRFARQVLEVMAAETQSLSLARLYTRSEEARRTREEVLLTVAHDLRDPLNRVAMVTSLLLETVNDETSAKHLRVVKRAGDRMNRLIQDLLDAVRIEAGSLKLERRSVPLAELLADAGEMESAAAEKGINLRLSAPDHLPVVYADPDRIAQVFSNLIGNAIKFTEEGGHITVKAQVTQRTAIVSVIDTGPGIDAAHLHSIFRKMWQVDKGDGRGIGLGLGIAKAIVEAHEGQLEVRSKVGEGTEFWFTLPLADETLSRGS